MKAAIYTRVSTLEQATEGYSIGVQKEKLTQYAAAMSFDVVDVYSDEGFSGKSLTRPDMERLLNDVRTGKIETVLIYKLDRLSRRVKDVLELVELFDKYNVTLFSLNENLDLSSPFGRAALKMSATFSELERETIVERMTMGKKAKKKAGRFSCPGANCPFGYRHNKETKSFTIDEQEANIIRKIFELYIQGYSFRKLYDYFREAHPDVKFFSNPMCCKPLIQRPMYAGYLSINSEMVKGTNFEPIISYETFLQAQAQIQKNLTKRTSDTTPYLLTGLIYCPRCGNRYVGKLYDRYSIKDGAETKRYKYRCYGCAARVKANKRYTPALCDNTIIRAEALEEKVEAFIKQIDIDTIPQGYGFVSGLIEKLMAENSALKDKKEKLLDLYLENTIDKEAYLLRLVELDTKIGENNSLIANETEKIQSAPTNSAELMRDKLASYDTLTKKEKRLLLHFLIKSIVIDGENLTINLNIAK